MKKGMSLLLALGMFATMLAPCAAAEEVTPVGEESAAVAELAALTEEAAPEEEVAAEETAEAQANASDAAPTEEVPAEVNEAAGDVAINATNFPDNVFRNYVAENCDTDKNGVLSAAEIKQVETISLEDSNVESVKGLEFFTSVQYLDFNTTINSKTPNKISSIDLSKNTELCSLMIDRNQLTSLDLSNNKKMSLVSCFENRLPFVDLSDNTLMYAGTNGCASQHPTLKAEKVGSVWQLNMTNVVGANRLSRVEIHRLGQGEYDPATGIITFGETMPISCNYDFIIKDLTVSPFPNNSYMSVYVTIVAADDSANTTPTATPAPVKGDQTKTAEFTERLYEICLGRKPDDAGKADWVNQLMSFRSSGTKAAYGFIFSPEFEGKKYSNADYVEHLYEAFMGRKSDAGGKADWVKQLEGGKSREEVFYGFADSIEFDKICTDYGIVAKDIETFVTRFYSVCLGRKPDAGGLADWSGKLRSKQSTGRDIAQGFIFSKEFTGKNYSDEDYVEHLYGAFMGRASDPAGKASWVSELKNGKSRQDVFNGFVGSKEFSDICASYDINRG